MVGRVILLIRRKMNNNDEEMFYWMIQQIENLKALRQTAPKVTVADLVNTPEQTDPFERLKNHFNLGDFPHQILVTKDVQELQTELVIDGNHYGLNGLVSGRKAGGTTWFSAAYLKRSEPIAELVRQLHQWQAEDYGSDFD
jgi:hypothetical protein